MADQTHTIAELDVVSAWDRLKSDKSSQLVDVRTRAEWTFVGVPELSALAKQPILIEWQTFPENTPDAKFASTLDADLSGRGLGKTTNLFFICRSGARSLSAARAMAALGYGHCHNVRDGFEGPHKVDAQQRQRGLVAGWKFANLPWTQG